MKKFNGLYISIIVLISIFSFSQASFAAEWTQLVFLNDCEGGASTEINKLELAGSCDAITIIAAWHNKKTGRETVYLIQKDDEPLKINSKVLSQTNIQASKPTLKAFNDFAAAYIKKYPSSKLIITLYDRSSIIVNNRLAVFESRECVKDLAACFAKISASLERPIDIIHFDADNFQCFELLYELAPFVNFVIGSEEKMPAAGTPYSFILDRIISQKELEPRRFCFAFVSAWQKYYSDLAGHGIRSTLSAINTAEFPMVTEKMDIFLAALKEDLSLEKHRKVFTCSVLKKVRRYINGQMVDAFDLGRLVNEEILEETVEQSSREFLASVTNATVKNSAIGDFGKIPVTYNSFGVSVFMPQPAPNLQNYSDLAFAKTTGWKSFLDFFYGFSLQRNW